MRDLSLACALAFQKISSVRHHSGTGRFLTTYPTSACAPSSFATCNFGPSATAIFLAQNPSSQNSNDSSNKDYSVDDPNKNVEMEFLKDELDHVESLQEIVDELEEFALDDFEDDDDDGDDEMMWSEGALSEIFGGISGDDDVDDEDDDFDDAFEDFDMVEEDDVQETYMQVRNVNDFRRMEERIRMSAAEDLERALRQGVVPASAGVGNEDLPGDYGFDPLHLAEKDYFRQTQRFLLNLLPGNDSTADTIAEESNVGRRPKALILRDLREAEVRHGRLAMLAAVFWPLQEMLDRLLLDPEQVGPILYGPVTLPYFPLIMTAIMLLLGYLDIYAQAIKEAESIGEAYLPGDCFWDPLRILQGAPDSMKRNMQERELLNGRVAMLAFAAFTWEEAITHLPLIEIGENDLLLEPGYEVPFIQQWLDAQFSPTDPEVAFTTPSHIDSPQTLKRLLDEAAESAIPN